MLKAFSGISVVLSVIAAAVIVSAAGYVAYISSMPTTGAMVQTGPSSGSGSSSSSNSDAIMNGGSSQTTSSGSAAMDNQGSAMNDGSSNGQTMMEEPVTHTVDIRNFAYSPSTITIKKGDTVVWTNHDSVGHTVTSDQGTELGSGIITTEDSYSHTFDVAGTYTYHCTIHPNMKGTVIVGE